MRAILIDDSDELIGISSVQQESLKCDVCESIGIGHDYRYTSCSGSNVYHVHRLRLCLRCSIYAEALSTEFNNDKYLGLYQFNQ